MRVRSASTLSGSRDDAKWHNASEGRVYERLLPYVEKVERNQSELFNRFEKLEWLYDPYSYAGSYYRDRRPTDFLMQENVIATNCDAISGQIAATEIRPRQLTDGADWTMQQQAKRLSWYAEGLQKLLRISETCRDEFLPGALKGTALVKTYIDPFGEIRSEGVRVDDIIVDDAASQGKPPIQLAERRLVSREVLLAQYPAKKHEIERAQTGGRGWKYWANYRPIDDDQIVVIESWRLPLGKKGKTGYVAGRHVVCIDGCDLVDEEWKLDRFPFSIFRWTKRPRSFYGIGGAERIIGHQRRLDKRNWHIDAALDRLARPVTYVHHTDAHLAVKTISSRLGTFGFFKTQPPVTVVPQAVSGETYKDRDTTKAAAFEEFGQSRMAASAMKPPGIDSGVALREYKDQTTQRFATQEKGYEDFVLDAIYLALVWAKELGANAPKVVRKSRFSSREINWADVDMAEVRIQLQAASTLGRTASGRSQMVMEMAQAGLISRDETRRLLLPNSSLDIDAVVSLYEAAFNDLDAAIEEMEQGDFVPPEPFQNLEAGIWRVQMALLRDRREGAPEDVLESLRQWISMADWMLKQANTNQAGAMPLPEEAAPGMPAGMPTELPPEAMGMAGPGMMAAA